MGPWKRARNAASHNGVDISILICLAVLDPMVVVPVGLVRSAGVRLASGVMALDVIANRIVNRPQLQQNRAWLLRPVGLLPTTLFGLFVIAPLVPLLRATRGVTVHLSCTIR
jgi:hypothetical protein